MLPTVLKGINTIIYARKLSEAKTKDAYLLPFLTSTDLTLSRSSKSTVTKSGPVANIGEVETDFSFEILDNDDPIIDLIHQSALNKETLEFWVVETDKTDSQGRAYSHYLQGIVSKDAHSSDPDSNSTRKITVGVNGTPKEGYLELNDSMRKQLDYVYKGLLNLSADETGKGVAAGEVETPVAKADSKSEA